MTNRSNVDTQIRGFYFAASGNDDFSGETIEVPKLTIQDAIDSAAALSPPPTPGASGLVSAAQGGTFADPIVMVSSVSLNGTDVTMLNTDPVTVTMSSFLNCMLTSLVNNAEDGIAALFDGEVLAGLNLDFLSTGGLNGIGVHITGECDDLFIRANKTRIQGATSTAFLIESTSPKPIDIDVDIASFDVNGTTFMVFDPVNATDTVSVDISSLTNFTGPGTKSTGTTGFVARGGILIIQAGALEANDVLIIESGAIVTLLANAVVGAITIEAGGTLHCLIVSHVGTITNNGTLNAIINGEYFGTWRQKHEEQVVLTAFSGNTQAPVATDTLLQIEFGAAQFGPTDPVQLSVLGAVTINQSDQYNVLIVLQYGRSGAAGSSAIVFFRILIDGVQFGQSRYAQLDNPNQAFPVQFSAPFDLLATQVLTVEFWRDSAGFNAGELMPRTPTLVGPNASPSASIILTRNRLVQPV